MSHVTKSLMDLHPWQPCELILLKLQINMTTLAPTADCLHQVKWLPGCMQRTTRAESSGTCKMMLYNVRIDLNYLSRCLGRKRDMGAWAAIAACLNFCAMASITKG